MSKLRDAAQQALEALETVLSDAYHRRFPECCGRPGSECCGNPNEAWAPEDNKIMDALSPVQRQLSDALRAALAEQPAEQEPVAWWHRKSNTFTSGNLVSNFAEWAPLYTAPNLVRDATLEEAAGVCDEQAHDWHLHAKGGPVSAYNACAAAIRAMKEQA